jgi:gamma-glutamyltranspeptidase/glutathione hydrolase
MDIGQIERSFESTTDGSCAEGKDGIVATAQPVAPRAGAVILEAGGNAFDAACGVGFALGVCEPQMSGLGGQTHGVIHTDGKTMAIDGSSRVPSLAHQSKYQPVDQRLGYRAATVPSTPATLSWLHEHYGKLPWRDVLQPAIEIARQGYAITQLQHDLLVRETEHFLSIPSLSGANYFLVDGERAYATGDRFVQTDLANCLETLAEKGVEDFYRGEVAQQIDRDMRANDGFIRTDDLAQIPWPNVREPLVQSYREVSVATMPPPGSGRTLLLTLLMLGHLRPAFLRDQSQSMHHFVAETFRKAFMQRLERPFDPNTYPQIRDKRMLSADFAQKLAASIAEEIDPGLPVAAPGEQFGAPEDETTHFSIMDRDGNVASITQSIELSYGARAAAAGLGFLYNNYMAALELGDPQHPYYLRPGSVPWSSSAPSIVSCDGEPWLALGSPGSERIYSSLAQCLMHIVDGSHSIDEAVRRPRLHCSIGGTVTLEAERFEPALLTYLEDKGYHLDAHPPFSFALGSVQVALKCRTKPGYQGIADPRRSGSAAGVTL